MKTMKLRDTIVRVNDNVAESYSLKGYVYCPKSEWKAKVRDLNKELAAKKEEAKREAKEKAKEKEKLVEKMEDKKKQQKDKKKK